jgi:CubicO group peptidase (beta-lactamase class C family)
MKELGIPGVAIALSDHGKVVYEGGFGVRELGKPAPVDANTLFMIASNTKGLTTLLLARLVDEGKLRWDEPVTQAYPSFRLGSDQTTKDVLIRHLVCACTGIPRKDFDWIFNTKPGTPATATFTQLANTEPTSKFGEVFQYSNLMASAAGYIAGHLVYPNMEIGAAYDRAMQTMIFKALGMDGATFDNALALREDHASPHGFDVNGHPAISSMGLNYTIVPYRPAGGAWASAHDMIKYVDDELAEGVLPNGKRLVSAENLLKRRAPSVPIGEDAFYGMGLMTSARDGVLVVHHGGDLVGFHSDWFAIPSAGVGAVILTNGDAGPVLRGNFQRRLLEVLYDGKPEAAGNVASAAASMKADMAKSRQELTLPPNAKAIAALARRYESPDLGHIDVSRDKAGVMFDFGMWKSHVATKKNPDGTMSIVTIDPSVSGFEFVVGSDGGKRTLTTRDGQHKYVYTEENATASSGTK